MNMEESLKELKEDIKDLQNRYGELVYEFNKVRDRVFALENEKPKDLVIGSEVMINSELMINREEKKGIIVAIENNDHHFLYTVLLSDGQVLNLFDSDFVQTNKTYSIIEKVMKGLDE